MQELRAPTQSEGMQWSLHSGMVGVRPIAIANSGDDAYSNLRATTLWGFATFCGVLRPAVFWLRDVDLRHLRKSRGKMLFGSRQLSLIAHTKKLRRCPLKPKHRKLEHAEREMQATKINACTHWGFHEEDNVNFMQNIARSSYEATLERTTLESAARSF